MRSLRLRILLLLGGSVCVRLKPPNRVSVKTERKGGLEEERGPGPLQTPRGARIRF